MVDPLDGAVRRHIAKKLRVLTEEVAINHVTEEVMEASSPVTFEKKHHVLVQNDMEGRQVMGVEFVKDDPNHDFAKMIDNPHWNKDTLFLYAENAHDFLLALCKQDIRPGGGSACMRPYLYPHTLKDGKVSMGIVTGYSISAGGFQNLSPMTKAMIDLNVDLIRAVIAKHDIKRIIFPCRSDNVQLFGSGIFHPSACITSYISDRLAHMLTIPLSGVPPVDFDKQKSALMRFAEHVTYVDILAKTVRLIPKDTTKKELVDIKTRFFQVVSTGQIA